MGPGQMSHDEESAPLLTVSLPERRRSSYAIAAAVLVLAGLGTIAMTRSKALKPVLDEQSELTFLMFNEYGSAVPGDGLYPWKYIAEPFKVLQYVYHYCAWADIMGPSGEHFLSCGALRF